jgi:phosphatidylglycerol:prolipoprotein diacylglycerol transferase
MMNIWVHEPTPFLWQWSEHWGIRYYGLAYLLGFLAVYGGLKLLHRAGWSGFPPEKRADLMTWMILGTLVGGRLGYALLYDTARTLAEPWSIVDFRNGGIAGMASHGGFAGVILALAWFTRRHGLSFWATADDLATLAPIGLGLGRVANYLNGELWGRLTDGTWGVVFAATGGGPWPRHPSQLYQAAGEGLFLFVVMLVFRSRRPAPGLAALLFLGGYCVVRFAVEFFREPDAHIGLLALGLSQGQWLSLAMLAVAGVLWCLRVRQLRTRGRNSTTKP